MKTILVVGILLLLSTPSFASFSKGTAPFSIFGHTLDGMKLVKAPPSDFGLARLGLKAGDIVMSANGVHIKTYEQARDVYFMKHIATVMLIRHGKPLVLGHLFK